MITSERAITRGLTNYCQAFDTRDEATFLGLWHPNARWRPRPGLVLSGIDEIRDYVRSGWSALTASTHFAAIPLIDFDGDAALVRSQALVITRRLTAERVEKITQSTVAYRDRFLRIDGDWLLDDRDVTTMIRVNLSS